MERHVELFFANHSFELKANRQLKDIPGNMIRLYATLVCWFYSTPGDEVHINHLII